MAPDGAHLPRLPGARAARARHPRRARTVHRRLTGRGENDMNRKQRRAAAKTSNSTPQQSVADNVVQKAIAAVQAGAMREAAQAFDQVLERFPNHVEALHQKGMLLARTGNVEAGIPYLQRAAAAQPNEALYWNNLAA